VKAILLTFGICVIGSGSFGLVIADAGSPAPPPISRALQQCLADYLIYQHDHPNDDYDQGILELLTEEAEPSDYDKSIYFLDNKESKENLKLVVEKGVNFSCTDLNPSIKDTSRSDFLGKTGSWHTDRKIIFKTTCSLTAPHQFQNYFLIRTSCNTTTHEAPSDEGGTWCSRTEIGSTFYAIFSNAENVYQLRGIGQPDEAFFATPPCQTEDDPRGIQQK
jgi:hypothetical protein